ncbi:ABC transporter ATP-binding protein [Vibrio parahaemolyticus]|uniref:ABC transporter-like protein n=1 Tax=Vibrio parahaemolyticus TaxID=670 RepID=A0A5Q5AXB1_VIBPH|nr:ABC transporter ATP-binding protein [Vibrio parahaemolyticus]ANQ57351.1 sugar ABC transporter ATPase [Vibrio parahaemolyticus]ASO17300.1 ABC transporter ATP-binding protein [Vibrio parahaemolyticus]AWA88129.1 ABC transporter ATP-binding protein [Vibrio parahaemolyticus]EGQ7715295.1 ABC transporter ATP-binding protein [Vibrio parahaemolyticus]EGQ7719999.1 ABC transporter ATP-binding protein [Vibrio parahaemolyticus]
MIKLDNLTKYYPSQLGNQYIFRNVSFRFPEGHNVAILGSNGAGKSTLFRIIAGSEYPNSGKVITDKAISWPVALATGIHPQMTGRENTRFIGRVNGVANLDEYEEKVKAFAELGIKYDLPVKSYSSGMRSRLAFGCCIAIDFDVYLIDEATSVGDQKFRKKAKQALLNKSKTANVIMVSHDIKEIREFCDSAVILHKGNLTFYHELEQALKIYKSL